VTQANFTEIRQELTGHWQRGYEIVGTGQIARCSRCALNVSFLGVLRRGLSGHDTLKPLNAKASR